MRNIIIGFIIFHSCFYTLFIGKYGKFTFSTQDIHIDNTNHATYYETYCCY